MLTTVEEFETKIDCQFYYLVLSSSPPPLLSSMGSFITAKGLSLLAQGSTKSQGKQLCGVWVVLGNFLNLIEIQRLGVWFRPCTVNAYARKITAMAVFCLDHVGTSLAFHSVKLFACLNIALLRGVVWTRVTCSHCIVLDAIFLHTVPTWVNHCVCGYNSCRFATKTARAGMCWEQREGGS